MAENQVVEVNGSDDEDEALRIAIALSLGQDPQAIAAINLTQDGGSETASDNDDDDELASAPKASPVKSAVSAAAAAPSTPAVISSLSALGLDRKKMEEERLARANKRKAADNDAPRPQQRQKLGGDVPRSLAMRTPDMVRGAPSGEPPALPFPKGVVKRTWVAGQPRLGDDIKIEEVLQKSKLELAVLSSFQWEERWLLSKVDIDRTKLILVAFAADKAQVSGTATNRCCSSRFHSFLSFPRSLSPSRARIDRGLSIILVWCMACGEAN